MKRPGVRRGGGAVGEWRVALALTVSLAASLGGCATLAWERQRIAARVAFAQQQYCDAEAGFIHAVTEAEAFGEHDRRLAETLIEFGWLYVFAERFDIVESLWSRALAIEAAATPADDARLAEVQYWLAELHRRAGRYERAAELHGRAFHIRERLSGPLFADSAEGLAATYHAQGRYSEAEPLLRRALRVRAGIYSPQPEALTMVNLARVLAATGRHEEAVPLYQGGISVMESDQGWYFQPKSEALRVTFAAHIPASEAQTSDVGTLRPLLPVPMALPDALDAYGDTLRALGRTAEAEGAKGKAAAARRRLDETLKKRWDALPTKRPPSCRQ